MKIFRLSLGLLTIAALALPTAAQEPTKTNPEILNRLKAPGAAPSIRTDASIAPSGGGGTTKSVEIPGGFHIVSSGIGYSFTSGTSDFDFGEIITPPLVDLDGNALTRSAAQEYWRAEPVRPGEIVRTAEDIALEPVPESFVPRYYYSPHAELLIASQTGSIQVKWMTAEPDDEGNYGVSPEFTFYTIGFGTSLTTRTMYWTEQDYKAPRVQIPGGIVQDVKIIYNDRFPASVSDANKIVPNGAEANNVENFTLLFDRTLGMLRAYNLEGRAIVEYLGTPRGEAGSGLRESLQFEIVQVRKELTPLEVKSVIGEQLLPSNSPGVTLSDRDYTPVQITNPAPQVAQHFVENRTVYYGIQENLLAPDVEFYWLEEGEETIKWPKLRNTYLIEWPKERNDFEGIFARPSEGSDEDVVESTYLDLIATNTPELLFQDDPLGGQASMDFQFRLSVDLSDDDDQVNRSLIRFNSGNNFWYVRLFSATSDYLLANDVPGETYDPSNLSDFHFNGTALVGQRLSPPDDSLMPGGYIDPSASLSGDLYHAEAYVSPFAEGGIEAANEAAIIPVNSLPGNDSLRVWWSRQLSPPAAVGDLFTPIFIPSVIADYTITYPADAPRIVMASNKGTGDLAPEQASGQIYVQNDPTQPGYNPNEEHALMISGRAYALRDDLNVSDVSSEPFVLISYDDVDGCPAVAVFEVLRELTVAEEPTLEEDLVFDYPAVAGKVLQAPFPLPVIPQPLVDGVSRNTEVTPGNLNPVVNGPSSENLTHYDQFTFQDRKGATWVYRGPHEPEVASGFQLSMQYYYPTLETFAFPNSATGADEAPALGTIVPYLRPLDGGGDPIGDPVGGTPLIVTFTPQWPEQTPILHFGETLAKPKFGLPQILGQKSAEIVYQQSIARDFSAAQNSVVLHDSTINRTSDLAEAGLAKLPATVLTTSSQGKIYFQGLPSHLEDRLFYDSLSGAQGTLIFQGRFNDEPVGEDYLQPNTLSDGDVDLIKELCLTTDEDRAKWETLIDNLQVVPRFRILDERNVEEQITYADWLEQEALGDFIGQNGPGDDSLYGPTELPELLSPDQVVNEYFLSAIGGGDGYVTLVTGNGLVNSEVGDPVQMHIFRVGEKIYRGELKPLVAANPLSEMVTVLHTGDFAGDSGSYQFEWRKAPPVNGLAPPVFLFQNLTVPGSLSNPALYRNVSTTAGQVTWGGATATAIPFNDPIYRAGDDRTVPGLRLKGTLDFSSQLDTDDRLNKVFLSLKLRDGEGAVVNLNGVQVLEFGVPGGNNSERAPGVPSALEIFLTNGDDFHVFELPARVFQEGANEVEVFYTTDFPDDFSSLLDFRVALQIKEDNSSNYEAVTEVTDLTQSLGLNSYVISGSGVEALGDNYFIMRYRPIDENHPLDQVWSDWTQPALVEGWIKRVLAGINPFNQRITDFFENAVDTNTSIIASAGSRWEGDIALNLDAVQNVGLIEIYETVLKRGINLSINGTPAVDYGPANDALLLAAGYLNDLYVALGNEAFADAANPMVHFDSQALGTLGAGDFAASFEENFRSTSTARFAFQGQVATLLDEELALLRGRDDSLSPSIQTPPVYNRMFWNYTRGIDAGELIYALNYNIREANDTVADGKVDAEDAARMFPQAHGDAYGHYLTAVKNYYRLLTDPQFTWGPRIEAVNVLGQPVSIDYFDERKFASSAAALARTANQVVSLERRRAFQAGSEGWDNLTDGRENPRTGTTRHWGVDDWAARGMQGAYFHWLVGNAILPGEDLVNEGIQKIDRSTVPELAMIASNAANIQRQIEAADRRVNPLDLTSDSLLIDISPADLEDGKTHFEQVYERALTALTNATSVFDRAADSTRLLRSNENQSQTLSQIADDEETAFLAELVDTFGHPYPGDIGPGKIYPQGYEGPDLLRYMLIDRPYEVFTKDQVFSFDDDSREFTLNVRNNTLLDSFDEQVTFSASNIFNYVDENDTTISYTMRDGEGPYIIAEESHGKRRSLGTIQTALNEVRLAEEQLYISLHNMQNDRSKFHRELRAFQAEMIERTSLQVADQIFDKAKFIYEELGVALEALNDAFRTKEKTQEKVVEGIIGSLPGVVGTSNDAAAPARGVIFTADIASAAAVTAFQVAVGKAGSVADLVFLGAEQALETARFSVEEVAYLRGRIAHMKSIYKASSSRWREVDALAVEYHRALENYRTELADGQRSLTNREVFRKRAAAAIQGYRTRDIAFRTFRTEALEEYQTLLDWSSKYAFLAAQAYDYETGLLSSQNGQAFLGDIISSRALGILGEDGQPTLSASANGDPGLSGLLAKLKADYDVVKGRLGFNNPETNGTTFSLRREYFRIPDGPEGDIAWQQKLESLVTTNLLADADIAAHAMQLGGTEASSQPGFLINFPSTIEAGKNFFGKDYQPLDSNFTPSNFATKVYSAGVVFAGYQGMAPCLICEGGADEVDPDHNHENDLGATPYVYLIPSGIDTMRTPPLANGQELRSWSVLDYAMPLPFDLGNLDLNDEAAQLSADNLRANFRSPRRHPAFRATDREEFFFTDFADDYTSSRLVGRSVWNSNWKLAIPAKGLLANEQEGISRFIRSVKDIKLHLRTYSYSGN